MTLDKFTEKFLGQIAKHSINIPKQEIWTIVTFPNRQKSHLKQEIIIDDNHIQVRECASDEGGLLDAIHTLIKNNYFIDTIYPMSKGYYMVIARNRGSYQWN